MIRDKFKKLHNYWGYIILFILLILYIVKGTAELVMKNADLGDLIGDSILNMLLALSINTILRTEGIKSARKTDIFINSLNDHGKIKNEVTSFIDKLPTFVSNKNVERKNKIVKEILLNYAIKEDLFFNNDIVYYKTLTREEKKAWKRAKTLKIEMLKVTTLTMAGVSKIKREESLGITESGYKSFNLIYDVVFKVTTVVALGFFVLEPIATSWSSVLWNMVIALLYVVLGFMSFQSAYDFMLNDFRANYVKYPTDLLYEFNIQCKREA